MPISRPRLLETTEPLVLASIFVSAAVFFALGLYVLSNGHPHEDAFILFIFAEELASTGRIAYYAGGPPAEGATDFLWMIAIAGLNLLGLSSGTAALVLNTVGIALLAGVTAQCVRTFGGSPTIAAACALPLPLIGFVQSGYGGFSAPLFAALAALIASILIQARGPGILLVPFLSIILGLFRPDGVILGVGFTLVGLAHCSQEHRKAYLLVSLGAALIGLIYFIWRWSYFGEFLPLPLMVKSEGNRLLNGLQPNLMWLTSNAAIVVVGGIGLVLASRRNHRVYSAMLPFLGLFLFLLFGVQSQNIAFRFQAPISAYLYLMCCVALAITLAAQSQSIVRNFSVAAALVLVFSNAVKGIQSELRYLTNQDYINYFPIHLRDSVPQDATTALTEAGRLAYWLPGTFIDLVGLNTAYTARNGANAEYIASLQPDMIFGHLADTARFPCEANVCRVSTEAFLNRTKNSSKLSFINNRVVQAPLAIFEFLEQNLETYDILAVRYGAAHHHIFAIAKDGHIDVTSVVTALEFSFTEDGQLSYLDAWETKNRQR